MATSPDGSYTNDATPKPITSSPENPTVRNGDLTVEDVTEEYDRGYEGDVEAQLPDETEEVDSESESELALQNLSPNEASLVKDFRKLQCETPKQEPLLFSLSGSRISRKRSHSRLLSDTDSETLIEVSRASTPSRKRQRRRLKDSHNQTETATREADDVMDVDSISSPLQAQ